MLSMNIEGPREKNPRTQVASTHFKRSIRKVTGRTYHRHKSSGLQEAFPPRPVFYRYQRVLRRTFSPSPVSRLFLLGEGFPVHLPA